MRLFRRLVLMSLFCLAVDSGFAQETSEFIGRWDLTMDGANGKFPSWLEIRKSGNATLVGSFCGQFGSARPISKIHADAGKFYFSIPPQWEKREDDQVIAGVLDNGKLFGSTTDENGKSISWTGVRAPELNRASEPEWGEPIELFNGVDLKGWKPLLADVKNGWVVESGLLYNKEPGQNIATIAKFEDFKLHAEFKYPKGSNSGIYLRGRYETQIEDNFGGKADSHHVGGIYGHLTPSSNAAKRHGEWQTYDIELVGRRITVVLNGERVIDRAEIPGITGGALDSNEGEPGPIYLQGDHGPVWFRKVTLTPAK